MALRQSMKKAKEQARNKHCCLVYWEGEDTVTVLSQEKVCYEEQIIGGSCIVREGRIIHTHGRLAAFGTKEELNGILKLFEEGSWKPSFLADTMDSDTVTTTAEPSIGSAAIPNIHVAILEPLLEKTASRVQKCTRVAGTNKQKRKRMGEKENVAPEPKKRRTVTVTKPAGKILRVALPPPETAPSTPAKGGMISAPSTPVKGGTISARSTPADGGMISARSTSPMGCKISAPSTPATGGMISAPSTQEQISDNMMLDSPIYISSPLRSPIRTPLFSNQHSNYLSLKSLHYRQLAAGTKFDAILAMQHKILHKLEVIEACTVSSTYSFHPFELSPPLQHHDHVPTPSTPLQHPVAPPSTPLQYPVAPPSTPLQHPVPPPSTPLQHPVPPPSTPLQHPVPPLSTVLYQTTPPFSHLPSVEPYPTELSMDDQNLNSSAPEPNPIAFTGEALPSSTIPTEELLDPKVVIRQYKSLAKDNNTVTKFALKLAHKAFFGRDILKQCTVMGEKERKGLPRAELFALKTAVFHSLPRFWNECDKFEPVWSRCVDALNGACRRERSVKKTN